MIYDFISFSFQLLFLVFVCKLIRILYGYYRIATMTTRSTASRTDNTNPSAKVLLLDMDGVLAEVSKSYRACILKTCHEYGASSVTSDTIAEWKVKGGCNNDWVLSLDLINADPNGTKNLTLSQITYSFESYYQGLGNTPGLCELETLIPLKVIT